MTEPLRAGALLAMHAQTPLHAGAGTALGVVDLPVQRERHTHWPNVAGSALKGVLRDAYREVISQKNELHDMDRWDDKVDPETNELKKDPRKGSKREMADSTKALNVLFGPPTTGAGEFAGALVITDGRLLAFPVRSLKGVFAWITCPEALRRLSRDVQLAGLTGCPDPSSLEVGSWRYLATDNCECVFIVKDRKAVILEEFDFRPVDVKPDAPKVDVSPFASWIATNLLSKAPEYAATAKNFANHFLILSDDEFTHFVRHATEVTARIGLDYESKTVKDGALFYQEFLPAESLLYSVVLLSPSRSKVGNEASAGFAAWKESVRKLPYLQVGGGETIGKGLCSIRLNEGGTL